MALTGWSTSSYLERGMAVWPGQMPFLVSAWVQRTSSPDNTNRVVFDLGQSGSGNHFRRMLTDVNDRITAFSRDGSSNTFTPSSGSVTVNQWVHGATSFISDNSHAAYRDGANKGTSTEERVVDAPDRTRIGFGHTNPFHSTSGIAEVSIWDLSGFTVTQQDSLVVKLAAGENPLNINTEVGEPWTANLVAYWKLQSPTDLEDQTDNNQNLTMVGTLTEFVSHPEIDGPIQRDVAKKPSTLLGVGL